MCMALLGLLGNPPWSGCHKAKSERRKKRLAKFGGLVDRRGALVSRFSGYELLSLATLWLSRPTYAAPLLAGFAVSGFSFNLLDERLARPNQGPTKHEPATRPCDSQGNCPRVVDSSHESDGKDSIHREKAGMDRRRCP